MVAADPVLALQLPHGTKGIVFDCDGTLLDTMTLHWQSWREACAHFRLLITLEWWRAQAGKTSDDILTVLCEMQVINTGRGVPLYPNPPLSHL